MKKIINLLFKYRQKVKLRENLASNIDDNLQEIKSAELVRCLSPKTYIPHTSSAISLANVAIILNDIVLNKRKCIIEFGSGISTIYIAALIKNNGLNCKFYSIDESSEWIATISDILEKENLSKFVQLIHAPLAPIEKQPDYGNWYEVRFIEQCMQKDMLFDCVIVDGPTAYMPGTEMRRLGAGKFLSNSLSLKASIFLDDINRNGEQKITEIWNKLYGWNFRSISRSMGACYLGSGRNVL